MSENGNGNGSWRNVVIGVLTALVMAGFAHYVTIGSDMASRSELAAIRDAVAAKTLATDDRLARIETKLDEVLRRQDQQERRDR